MFDKNLGIDAGLIDAVKKVMSGKTETTTDVEVLDEKKLDSVDKDEVKKDFDDREDKDIDNDGDSDSSDEYLHKKRKAISKALEKKK